MARSEGQKQSQSHEKRLAAQFEGQRTAASGAFWQRKGDVRTPDMLIEHKWTGKKSFTLTSTVLEKIVEEAILDYRTPILGVSLNDKNYVLLTEDDFIEMYEKAARPNPIFDTVREESLPGLVFEDE